MVDQESVPKLCSVVLDCTDARALAEFYRQLLGFVYRPGDEPPAAGQTDERGRDWLVLVQHERVLRLGGRLLYDRVDDPDEPLRVYADLAGHPFCVFVG
ncbi:VOC family protein [Micromonospora sp. NPDC005220]|uniref:VOC family protein n=1 Tax=Micromonospora sp. NPDC005220 TaxID=3155589 RepID=UPI0033B95406